MKEKSPKKRMKGNKRETYRKWTEKVKSRLDLTSHFCGHLPLQTKKVFILTATLPLVAFYFSDLVRKKIKLIFFI